MVFLLKFGMLGDKGIEQLANLFNKLLRIKKVLDKWRISIVVPTNKDKENIQSCTNYRVIKIMSQ